MDISKIPAGVNPPEDINVLIEIPIGGAPVKYEFDKESGALYVDRILHTAMFYPGHYGFVPHTLSEDGDPVDVIIFARTPVVPGCVMRCRPIGVLFMEDEAGGDEKILAVPHTKLHPMHADVESHEDLPQIALDQIAHFFEHYKDLEKNKWVKVKGWEGPEAAKKAISDAVDRYNAAKA